VTRKILFSAFPTNETNMKIQHVVLLQVMEHAYNKIKLKKKPRIHTYIHAYIIHTYIHAHIHTYIYIYTYIHIYIHT